MGREVTGINLLRNEACPGRDREVSVGRSSF